MPKKLTIVAIDDSQTVCKILETIAHRAGHDAFTYVHPVTALDAIFTYKTVPVPDVMIVDLLLPEVNGLEVISKTRKLEKEIYGADKRIKIVVLSRLDGVLKRIHARLAGADEYMVKPFETQNITQLIEVYATAE